MLTRMLQRRGTSAQWEDVKDTLILASGEIGIIVDDTVDNGKFKIGDGTTLWKDLSFYFNDSQDAAKYAQLTATQTFVGSQVLTPNDRLVVPLVVAGASSQSANLQVWKNSSDVILASVNKDGDISAKAATFDGIVNVNSHKITNVADPTSDSDAANKLYVDNAIAGLSWKAAINLAATTNVALTGTSGTLSIDGHPALTDTHGDGYRILLLNQTTVSENGIYDYSDNGSTYSLTRSSDADTPEELRGASVFIQEGDVYGTSSWVQTNHYLSDFANQDWIQFNGASQITAGNGIVKNGNVIDVVGTTNRITANADSIDIASTYAGQTSINTLGTVTTGTWNADTVAADKGGTGYSSYTTGDILYASGTSQLAKLSAGTANYVLRSAGAGNAPTWGQVVTASLANSTGTSDGVTYAKMQYVSADHRVLGRLNGGSGLVEELTPDALLAILNTSLELVSYDILPVGTTAGTVAAGDHTHTLDNLSDVIITGTPVERQVIKFNGTNWINELPSGGISVGATPPANAAQGDAWFDSTDGSLYVRYDDGVGSGYASGATSGTAYSTGSGFSTYLALTYTHEPTNNRFKVDYTFTLTSLSSSWFTNYALSGSIVIGGATVWTPSGTYSVAAGQSVILTSGTTYYSYPSTDPVNSWPTSGMVISSSTNLVKTGVPSFSISASTSNYVIVTNTSSSAQWVQVKANSALEASILTRMSAVESRATVIEAANAIRVANATERDSKFPAPVQGNTVFRADLGYEEKYYAAYNATTNPDGTTGTVGWYRYAGGAPLSQNYVINGAMDWWQRGTTSTTTAHGYYTLDRFATRIDGGTGTWSQETATVPNNTVNALKFTASASNTYGNIIYTMETKDAMSIAGKTITISSDFYKSNSGGLSVLARYSTSVDNASSGTWTDISTDVSLVSPTTWTRTRRTVAIPSNAKSVQFVLSNNTKMSASDYFIIANIQIEEGPVATPFRRNQPNPQAELAACQRYYYKTPTNSKPSMYYNIFNSGNCQSSSLSFPVSMRIAPTITVADTASTVGKITIANAGGTQQTNITPPTYADISTNMWQYNSGGIGGTTGNNGMIFLTYYEANAEL